MQQAPTIDYKEAYEALLIKYEALLHDVAQLRKMVFGSQSERFVATDDNKVNPQLSLDLDAETIAACKITDATKVAYIRTKTEVIPPPQKLIPVV
jgi:hypothetical protein